MTSRERSDVGGMLRKNQPFDPLGSVSFIALRSLARTWRGVAGLARESAERLTFAFRRAVSRESESPFFHFIQPFQLSMP